MTNKYINGVLVAAVLTGCSATPDKPLSNKLREASIDLSQYELAWRDEFDYPNEQLDENWISQNGPTENIYVLSSRWRENAVVKDGVLHLMAKKESRGGQDWTTGNVWSKRSFHYGYFEARYKYAAAHGTNNSFWFWPKQGVSEGEKACEIDVNEGHYPNIINTNVHNWTDNYTLPNGKKWHLDNQLHHTLIGKPEHNITLKTPIKTSKLRLTSIGAPSIHISEFQVLAPFDGQYPKVAQASQNIEIVNHAMSSDVKLTTSGIYRRLPSEPSYAIDGDINTRWVSKKDGPKLLELSWSEQKEIGAIQFLNGWQQEVGVSKGAYRNLISDYKIEYFDGENWQLINQYDSADVADFANEFHTYGLEWDEDYLKFYFDGKLFYTMRNDVCFSETTLLFSLALLKYDIAGPVTDAIDGTSMAIDWVRYYTKKQ